MSADPKDFDITIEASGPDVAIDSSIAHSVAVSVQRTFEADISFSGPRTIDLGISAPDIPQAEFERATVEMDVNAALTGPPGPVGPEGPPGIVWRGP
jgi:hypothetical protein